MNRFYSTKQAMEAQVTTLQELVVDIPLVEPDTERFVQMIKAEMFLAEEALNWVSEEPEFLKNVLVITLKNMKLWLKTLKNMLLES